MSAEEISRARPCRAGAHLLAFLANRYLVPGNPDKKGNAMLAALGGSGSDLGGSGSDLRDAKANGARYIGATFSPPPIPRQM